MQSAIRLRDNVMLTELDGEAVVLNVKTEKYFWLDDVATRMWRAICEHETIEHAIAALLALYDVDEATLRTDLERLLHELQNEEIIEWVK